MPSRSDGPVCLDIGCGDGADLSTLRDKFPSAILYGLDIEGRSSDTLTRLGVRVSSVNLEFQRLEMSDGSVDVVIANQVFEHLKNWVFALSEVARVLRKGGSLIVGVPNLASMHNRIGLIAGRQPSCIELCGMHVRGFTLQGLTSVLQHRDVFKIVDRKGRVIFPFPRGMGRWVSDLWPGGASSIFVLAERVGDSQGFNDIEALRKAPELSLR
jgi:trans-aconitate methyltransferase